MSAGPRLSYILVILFLLARKEPSISRKARIMQCQIRALLCIRGSKVGGHFEAKSFFLDGYLCLPSLLLCCIIRVMSAKESNETFVDREVTYTVEVDGQLVVIENVPARVCVETGEQLFSPETVAHLQRIIWERGEPIRMMEVPVYNFA